MKRKHILLYGLLISAFFAGIFELSCMVIGPVATFGACVAIVIIAGVGLPLYQITKR